MKNIQSEIQDFKRLETYAHVNLDDIINKVTQEVSELIEADENWDVQETYKEAWDVLVNVLSVSHELWMNFDIERKYMQKSNIDLSILNWKWNSKIQALRNKYSKENITLNEAESITKELVESVLNYTNPKKSLSELVKINTQKFEVRKDSYKPKINLNEYIDSYPDFPKKWIHFKDISRLLTTPEALKYAVNELSINCKDSDIIVWLDARGFIFWSLVAQNLNKPFVMFRKKWKLPWNTKNLDYWLEYWNNTLEIQTWKIDKLQKVSIIDDLLATWWTVKAAIDLIESEWWIVNNLAFVIALNDKNLVDMKSRNFLSNYEVNSLLNYND